MVFSFQKKRSYLDTCSETVKREAYLFFLKASKLPRYAQISGKYFAHMQG
jgi:hypothetical protein